MNIYKNLLFLQGHFADPNMDEGFGPRYGNRVANARELRERWEPAHAAIANALAPAPADAVCATACGQVSG